MNSGLRGREIPADIARVYLVPLEGIEGNGTRGRPGVDWKSPRGDPSREKGAARVKRAPVFALTAGLITLLAIIPSIFREAGATNPVLVVGEFSNVRFTAEHAYGYSVQLWRQGDDWFGLLNVSEGLIGDTPTGFLNNVTFEGRTSRLSFTAKMVTGLTLLGSSPPYKEVPVCERFEFRGVLGATALVGAITRDRLQPTKMRENTANGLFVLLNDMDAEIRSRYGLNRAVSLSVEPSNSE